MSKAPQLITSDQLRLAQLNTQVELVEEFLRLHVWVLWQLVVIREQNKRLAAANDELQEQYNRLLHVTQTRLYQDAYEHLINLLEHYPEE